MTTPAFSPRIQLARSGPVGLRTLEHPASFNSLSLETIKQLLAAIQDLARDAARTRASCANCANKSGWCLLSFVP